MRRCLAGDLLVVAEALSALPEALSALPEALRLSTARRLIHEAHAAHHYTKRFARPHPRWGNGSLLTRVLADPRPVPTVNPDWSLVALVATALAEFRKHSYLRPSG